MLSLPLTLRFLLAAVTGLTVMLAPLPGGQPAPQERTLRVEASAYQFEPGVVRVNRGPCCPSG